MKWQWILVVLIVTSVVGVALVSAVNIGDVCVIRSYGIIKAHVPAASASVSIWSYGTINYERESSDDGGEAMCCLWREGLNISEPFGLMKSEPIG